jgi:SAM-dependent methyltransferase
VDATDPIGGQWYYSIELEPGVFTRGHDHRNIALTRKLLRQVTVTGQDCFDIGTQEALVPILLKKAGARVVNAYDRRDLSARIELLQKVYGVDFHYVGGLHLRDLPARLERDEQTRFFDLVVFSGVLYHLIDPLGLLALVRGFCKVGGLFLIETGAIQHATELLFFNTKGQKFPGANYFLPTTAWLDYALRMLGLQPLHAVYDGSLGRQTPVRVAVLCRSMAAPCPADPQDAWVHERWHQVIFEWESQLDWKRLAQTQSAIQYRPYDRSVATVDERGLVHCLSQHPPHEPKIDELRLSLASQM